MKEQYGPGRKDDTGKSRVDLISPEAIILLGDVLAFGASKYKTIIDLEYIKNISLGKMLPVAQIKNTLQNDCVLCATQDSFQKEKRSQSCANVASQYTVDEFANLVMINGLNQSIQNILKNKKKTQRDGIRITSIELEKIDKNGLSKIEKNYKNKEEKRQEELVTLSITICLQLNDDDVQYVEEALREINLMSITVTKQGGLDDCYVVSATKDWGYLEIIQMGLSLRCDTCKTHQLNILLENANMVVSGENNWQNVKPFNDRYYAAALRHLLAWKSGEKIDQESGLPHLGHAFTCLMFLIWKEQ